MHAGRLMRPRAGLRAVLSNFLAREETFVPKRFLMKACSHIRIKTREFEESVPHKSFPDTLWQILFSI